MVKPIAIFYHCAFRIGDKRPMPIIREQMLTLAKSKLHTLAQAFFVGINDSPKSEALADTVIPSQATKLFHGLDCKTENLTLIALWKWAKEHPRHNVLYFHAKGSSHDIGSLYGQKVASWRHCMERHLITNWLVCVNDLNNGADTVGCHLFAHLDGKTNYWAGNCWWAKSEYLASLPNLATAGACKVHGPKDARTRYEAEIWIGSNGRRPRIRDYHPNFAWNCRG